MGPSPHLLRPGPENRVARITQIYANASTFPCRVVTEAGGEWVMKLRGAGPGPVALLTELLGLRAARAMGLAVPSVQPLYLPPDFPWVIGTDEFDGIVQRSFGWNLGIEFVPNAFAAAPEQILSADPRFLKALVDADRLLANTDRSARNTNILARDTGFIAIDFDACLFLRRALRGLIPSDFDLMPGHLLQELSPPGPGCAIDVAVLINALRDAPSDWLDFLDLPFDDLADNLAKYASAWNAARLAP